jgi:hypothetical protein
MLTSPVTAATELSPNDRDELARAWARDALMEHASVASFARFTLELLACGAPPELVAASQQAGADEVAHARSCFALAARFAEQPIGPGPLELGDRGLTGDLGEMAALAVVEGCVGETLAAAMAEAQLTVAIDPECRRTLARIASDEAEHSLLAWRFVRYAMTRGGGAVARAVGVTFRQALESKPVPTTAPATAASSWNHFGRLTLEQEREVVHRTWVEVIMPAARTLLAGHAEAVDAC